LTDLEIELLNRQGIFPSYVPYNNETMADFKEPSRRICAWCGDFLGYTTASVDSHGICCECSEKMLNKYFERSKNAI
jgi:hypothetical protein